MNKKLGDKGLESVWTKVFSLIKLVTGDVEVSSKGTLQKQILDMAKVAFTGKYTDLTGTPNLFTAEEAGLVPAPAAGKQTAFLRGDGTWQKTTTSYLVTEEGQIPDATLTTKLREDVEELQTGLNEVNSNLGERTGTYTDYITFTELGDYWWVSSPIPLLNASKYNIELATNIKNMQADVNIQMSPTLFRITKCHDSFVVMTNDQTTAGYIFKTLHPDRVWECKYVISE